MKPPRKTAKPRPAPGEPRPAKSPELQAAAIAYHRAALLGTQEELDLARAAYHAQQAEDARKHAERAKEQQAEIHEGAARTPEHPEEEKRAA